MVIVISGPIASGKSTVARELAIELERGNVRVAVIDLDLVHDRLTTDEPTSTETTWSRARHAAADVANTLLNEGVAVLVAEGSFNTPGDRAEFARNLDTGVSPLYVTLRVSFEEALRRAQGDPTRGKSRDPAFLEPYFEAVNEALATLPATDLVIDTEHIPPGAAAAAIARRVRLETSN
jgi:predicted kinase